MASVRQIDLQQPLNFEDTEILTACLNKEENLFAKIGYTVKDTPITFSNTVIWRCCHSLKNTGQIRYEVLSQKPLGKGGFGTVFLSIATLVPLANGTYHYKQKPPGKQRVVKIQDHRPRFDNKKWGHANVLREYEMMKRAGYPVKKPTQINIPGKIVSSSVLVMRLLGARNLSKIRKDDASHAKILTTQERFSYTLNILQTMQEHLVNKKVVHRDIKTSNLRVDENHKVYLIDFGFAKEIDEKVPENVGSCAYIPPEALKKNTHTDFSSDLYSASLIIGQLWGADRIQLEEKEIDRVELILEKHTQYQFENLFLRTKDLSQNHRDRIRQLLENMHHTEPHSRPAITEVIQTFETICLEHSAESVTPEMNDSSFQLKGMSKARI